MIGKKAIIDKTFTLIKFWIYEMDRVIKERLDTEE
jgi:hypothetical protein